MTVPTFPPGSTAFVAFHGMVGKPIRLIYGQDAEQRVGWLTSHHETCVWRALDNTPYMEVRSLQALPNFDVFEPWSDLVAAGWTLTKRLVGAPPTSAVWTWRAPDGETFDHELPLDALPPPPTA